MVKILKLEVLELLVRKLIKRNFAIYIDTMKSYLRNKTNVKKVEQTNYWKVLMGIPILGLIILATGAIIIFPNKVVWATFLVLNIAFLLLHSGFIKFGSRVDIFLPLNSNINVKKGQRVIGGITVLSSKH